MIDTYEAVDRAIIALQQPYPDRVSDWVEQLGKISGTWKRSDKSIRQLFEAASPRLEDRDEFLRAVAAWLNEHPDMIDTWHRYSLDKRASPSPYFDQDGPVPLEVGFYSLDLGGRVDITQHTDVTKACADFIFREAVWVLKRERVT